MKALLTKKFAGGYLSLASFAVGSILSGRCTNLYYVNDPVVLANVKKKNDYSVAAGLNFGEVTSGLHLHGSVAISDRHFLIGSFTRYSGVCSGATQTGGGKSLDLHYTGNSFLAGAGYYKAMGPQWFFEGAAGGKYGTNANVLGNDIVQFSHVKWFIQPGLAFTSDYLQFGLGLRCGVVNFMPPTSNVKGGDITTPASFPYLDPAVYVSTGGRKIKVGLQVSVTVSEESSLALIPFLAGTSLDPASICLILKVTIPSAPKRSPVY